MRRINETLINQLQFSIELEANLRVHLRTELAESMLNLSFFFPPAPAIMVMQFIPSFGTGMLFER